MAESRSFIAELGRRHVWRAAVLYAGTIWALSQGVAQLTPALGLPGYATRWFLIAAAIGFPFWFAFAWFYEFTPQGLKRETGITGDAPHRHTVARKLDFAIIGVMAVAIALLASGYFIRRHPTAATTAFHPPADTLVVLPFTNLDKDPRQQYFSDGITEELTNALGQNTGLRVIAWNTASRFRDSTQSATDIGKTLDVANVLTGKILRQGNEVRVIVELVNARTGYQTWSSHYDDSLANIFQVQDHITRSISDALKVKFAAARAVHTVNPQAYDLVQQARAVMHVGLASSTHFEQARALLQRAIALDPDYAEAHGLLARTWSDLIGISTLSLDEGLARVQEEADKALSLDPRNVDALIALGNAEATRGDDAKARTEYEHALAIDPSNAVAHLDYGNMLSFKQGLVQYLKAVQLDPENTAAQSNVALIYMDLGKYRQELAYSQTLVRLAPHSAAAALNLAQNYALLHRDKDAVKAFDEVQPDTELGKALVAAGRLAYQSVLDPALRDRALAAADALYRRHDLDAVSQSDLMEIYLVLGKKDPALELLSEFCKFEPYSCADFPDDPTYNLLRGDQRFEALEKKYGGDLPPASAASSAPSSP
ncbi:MAG TPA: tetratricopeptide repeat protein [Rhodanobacteraceae bacterium]|nr:tetratricopeptide repeat protein [Rhodanobacteraceae bacterium]